MIQKSYCTNADQSLTSETALKVKERFEWIAAILIALKLQIKTKIFAVSLQIRFNMKLVSTKISFINSDVNTFEWKHQTAVM